MSQFFLRVLRKIVPTVLLLATLVVLLYGTGYYVMRTSVHDTLHETASSVKKYIESITDIAQLQTSTQIDLQKDFATAFIIYDNDNKVLASNVQDVSSYKLPSGLLQNADSKGSHAVTWQPNKDIRLATYILSFQKPKNGYILTARNMKDTDAHANELKSLLLISSLVALVLLLSYYMLEQWFMSSSLKSSPTTSQVQVKNHVSTASVKAKSSRFVAKPKTKK